MSVEFKGMGKETKCRCCFTKQHKQSYDVQLTCEASDYNYFFFTEKKLQQVYKAKARLFVWDLFFFFFLNAKVIQSAGSIPSPLPPLQSVVFASVRLCIPLCTAGVYFCMSVCDQNVIRNFVSRLSLIKPLSSGDVPLRRRHCYFPGWL